MEQRDAGDSRDSDEDRGEHPRLRYRVQLNGVGAEDRILSAGASLDTITAFVVLS
jgi:hypothetical protein